MKIYRNFPRLIVALTLLLTLGTGCGSKNDNPTDVTQENDLFAASATFSFSDGIGENGFLEGIKATDYVENFSYKALPIPSDIHTISEDSVQAEIDDMLYYYTEDNQITNRAVADGDTVNIDYVGSVDGVPFGGGSTNGQGTDVTIGVTSYIDDFLEQLIGHMPGETFNVEVTFPDVYQEESLQGKDAVFVTTVNYIAEAIEPVLNDDFVNKNFYNSDGWKTVAEMRESLAEKLKKEAIQQYVDDYLSNNVVVSSVPDKLIQYQETAMLRYYRDYADYYEMDFNELLETLGVSSVDELIESNKESNLGYAKYILAIQSVAEEAGISVSEDDMINFFTDYSQYEEQYGLNYLKQLVLFQNVVDYISANAVLE